MTLEPGCPAPAFALIDDRGMPLTLADFRGRKLVLYFFPKAGTPGCTNETNDFNALAADFEKTDTALLGISADSAKKLANFRTKHAISFPLAGDEAHALLEAYGVWKEKSMYGRAFMGIERTTVLIDAAGRIARVWHRVKVPGHAAEVLEAARGL
ncbi:peroxiredoxin [Ancylobacter sp. 6x-1]|uniref:thioredoxin-dependent peroxiredoxin n=1 Tax=Ancylobacter crimeensis TaxID=2579147 RepID=A0ABT0D6A2_9HYPH|nr:peroxiredoxin [Ancylobacter crimeensis]MCK0195481.1 peroxiredoxin [Ancylobacter crimeensis]